VLPLRFVLHVGVARLGGGLPRLLGGGPLRQRCRLGEHLLAGLPGEVGEQRAAGVRREPLGIGGEDPLHVGCAHLGRCREQRVGAGEEGIGERAAPTASRTTPLCRSSRSTRPLPQLSTSARSKTRPSTTVGKWSSQSIVGSPVARSFRSGTASGNVFQ
jgi:hypothetical protein